VHGDPAGDAVRHRAGEDFGRDAHVRQRVLLLLLLLCCNGDRHLGVYGDEPARARA
jgi:hypothetical protein